MSPYVVVVDFRLQAGAQAAFRALIDANARTSAHDETGCHHFDVVEPSGETDRILLYEIYTDRAAFEVHLKSPHFLAFNAESAALVASRTITTGDLVCQGAQ